VLLALLALTPPSIWSQSSDLRAHRGSAPVVNCSIPGLTPKSARKLTYQDLLDSYNAQAAHIHSIQASAIVHASLGTEVSTRQRETRPFPAEISFRSPASLRMTGVIPFSSRRTFDLSSDGREFRLLIPDRNKMRFIIGPVDSPVNSSDPRENIRPQMILEALRWLPARLLGSLAQRSVAKHGSKAIEVELRTSTGRSDIAQLEFDLNSGTLARLTISDAKDKNPIEVAYSDWQKVPDGEAGGNSCFPKRIMVSQQQIQQLEMKFLSLQLNSPMLPSKFHVNPPPGIAVTRVGDGGK